MKTIRIIILFSLISATFALYGCSKGNNNEMHPVDLINLDTISFNHSMKGWELYSWPNGNDWNYSILVGTNRTKSYSEVTKNKIVVFGIDSLKMLLGSFPKMSTYSGSVKNGLKVAGKAIMEIFLCLI
jgi:hypothetical protein